MGMVIPPLIALICGVFAFLAGKAGMKTVSKFFGVVAFLTFVGWLASGPGFTILGWFQAPESPVEINRR